MNLGGVLTDLPLYDEQGQMVYAPADYRSPVKTEDATKLVELVKEQLAEVDDVGTDLMCGDEVNVYDYESGEYYTVTISGGKNGDGLWSNYLKVMSDLLLRLEDTFSDAWIRKFDIDVTDDLFTAEVAVIPFVSQVNNQEF